ncbi:MAG: copper amine oxidase N-terminal domain-containing protein [Clostridia bacterium]|nr:copper amine oxidase N-terminal domain-containing protein [Clostridia bacterium]
MKKYLKLISALLAVVVLAVAVCAPVSADDIKITVNGKEIKPDTPPVIVSDRTLVPIRFIAEAFGYEVKWLNEYKAVKIVSGDTEISMFVGSNLILKTAKGEAPEELYSDVEAEIYNDRTFVPLRAAAEALGVTIEWDNDTRTVVATK